MFDNLTERLNRTLKNISGKGRITEDNIRGFIVSFTLFIQSNKLSIKLGTNLCGGQVKMHISPS